MRIFNAQCGLQKAVLVSLLFLVNATAQTSTATLKGVVRDQSGALIPGVTIKVTDNARNTSLSMITNEEGSYAFQSLNPGT